MASATSDSRTVYHDEPIPADQVVLLVQDPEPSWPAVRVAQDEYDERPDVFVKPCGRPGYRPQMFGLYRPGFDDELVFGLETAEVALTLARRNDQPGWEVRVHPSAEAARAYLSVPLAPLVLRYIPQAL
jgi:hypothetical protein